MKKKQLLILGLILMVALAVIWIGLVPAGSDARPGPIIICMGDSLTESEFGYYPKHLQGLLKQQGIAAKVITAARPGNTSGEYLDYLKRSGILEKIRPDMTIVMLGTNDVRVDRDHTPLSRYRHNMIQIISRIKAGKAFRRSPTTIFIASIPPIFKIDLRTFDESSKKRVEEEIVPAIRNLARQEQIHFIDVFSFFQKRPELMAGIHPRKRGYFGLARFIFDCIRPYLEVE